MSAKLIAVFVFLVLMRVIAQTVITLAGGSTAGTTGGSTNGVGTAALFNQPAGVTVDTSGNVILADRNHLIRLIYPNLTVITLAGSSSLGSNNGVGTAALFNLPRGVALDTSGNVIVADCGNHKIRLIYPNRTVITLAGGSSSGTTTGSNNGVGTAALFNFPNGVAVDSSGSVLVADSVNHKVRLIYPNRTVITLAGGGAAGNAQGSTVGVGTAALFRIPFGVAADTSGNVIVADRDNHKIRLIYPNLTVITLAGGSTTGTLSGSNNGVGTAALFNFPYGVAVDTSGNVYVADFENRKVRLTYPNLTVITLAGGDSSGTTLGSTNGVGTAALFNAPHYVAVDTSGNVIVTDFSNHKIRLIYPFTCFPGTYANFTSRSCILCPSGLFSATAMASSCSPCTAGTYGATAGLSTSACTASCNPGTYSTGGAVSCTSCPAGSFTMKTGATSCEVCPGGHYCPAGTSSWARLNCGRGYYCPDGSALPIPCPIQIAPLPYFSWASHPAGAQGPAFLMETAHCLNHCFWNLTSGDGMLSKC
jgi:serine/threonine-protein kinase